MGIIFDAIGGALGWLIDSGLFWPVAGPVLAFAAVVALLIFNGLRINGRDHRRELPGGAQHAFDPFRSRGRVGLDGEHGPVDLTDFVHGDGVPSRDTLVMGASDGQAQQDEAGGEPVRPVKRRFI